MADLPPIRNFALKVIFLCHFLLISLSSMGNWSTHTYVFYNLILMVFIIWSVIDSSNEEPLQLAIVVNALSVVLDILLLILYFPSPYSVDQFSGAMAIIHLLLRPVSIFKMVKILEERGGSSGSLTGLLGGSGGGGSGDGHPGHSSYEDIDRGASQATGSYDFSRAQQI